MERIRCNKALCRILRRALEDADMSVGLMRIIISDGKIVLERIEEEKEIPVIDEDVYEACEYIIETADDDELLGVYETLGSELEERGIDRLWLRKKR